MSSALRKHPEPLALEALVANEPWDYLHAKTQYLTHNIHRYSGKFIPQIAGRVIEMLSAHGELVLDPYCGSGTVLVEAALKHRRALGVDLNPLAVLIARTKITPMKSASLTRLRQEMAEMVGSLNQKDAKSLFSTDNTESPSDERLTDSWFTKWFRPDVLFELTAIERSIARLEDQGLKSIALVAFSDILRKSSNAHTGYPNVMFDRKATARALPGKPFLRALDRICAMVGSLSTTEADWDDVSVERGNATELPVRDNSVDLIVTHPPYIGSIPYAEYGLVSLKWLGHDPKELDRQLTGGRRQAKDVVERFRHDYGRMISECHRVLRDGRHAFFMVGNPLVKGQLIDLAAMTCDLAHGCGFVLAARTERKAVNRRANKMGDEHLLFFQKVVR